MSKELEALKELRSFCGDVYFHEIYDKDYQIIETALKDYEALKIDLLKESAENDYLKMALEIIKATWKLSFFDEEQMITIDGCYSIIFHNKEQYDLLKEVLK